VETALKGGLLLAVGALGGCGGDLPGFYWDLTQATQEDLCHDTPAPLLDKEGFEYRVLYDVQDITVAIGEDEFATGTAQGCLIQYSTVIWPEDRNDFQIAWQMDGAAAVSRGGGDGCTISDGVDWDGTEVFTIVTSEDPSLAPGCTYTVHLTGTYTKEVQ
jgi:hypothetical protein